LVVPWGFHQKHRFKDHSPIAIIDKPEEIVKPRIITPPKQTEIDVRKPSESIKKTQKKEEKVQKSPEKQGQEESVRQQVPINYKDECLLLLQKIDDSLLPPIYSMVNAMVQQSHNAKKSGGH